MDRKTFIFNVDWQEILMEYPPEVRLEVYDAVIRYAASGTLSELKPQAKMAFSFIKREIDFNNSKYDDIAAKRSEAGRRSAALRQNQQTSANPTNVESVEQSQQTSTTANYNVYDNVNDNIKESEEKKRAAFAATHNERKSLEERQKEFYNELMYYVSRYGAETVRAFFNFWTETDQSGTKMRFELQKTWQTAYRLSRWAKRNDSFTPQQRKKAAVADIYEHVRDNDP